jgi:PncC family amidohydrolase
MTAEKLVTLLKEKNMTIAVAESCTGGAFMAALVKIAGVSEVFGGGTVVYSEEAKVKLGVRRETVDKYGVVSKQAAKEMANSIKLRSSASISVAITGFAGPTGERVGEVHFWIDISGKQYSIKKNFGKIGRDKVIDACVEFLIGWFCETL